MGTTSIFAIGGALRTGTQDRHWHNLVLHWPAVCCQISPMDISYASACFFSHEIAGCLLRRVANQQSFEAAILVGHSYGGTVAVLTLALLEVMGSRAAFAFLVDARSWYPRRREHFLGSRILSDHLRLNKRNRFADGSRASQIASFIVPPRAKQLTSIFELFVFGVVPLRTIYLQTDGTANERRALRQPPIKCRCRVIPII